MPSRSQSERRKYLRTGTGLPGRYMLADRQEFDCTVVDVSFGGMLVSGPLPGAIGERVIVYLDDVGRFEGNVERRLDEGFAIRLAARASEKLNHAWARMG